MQLKTHHKRPKRTSATLQNQIKNLIFFTYKKRGFFPVFSIQIKFTLFLNLHSPIIGILKEIRSTH
jgi:hypothetical protein